MGVVMQWVEFADRLSDLIREHGDWSQKTFGPDNKRGAIGPAEHLVSEAGELVEALKNLRAAQEFEHNIPAQNHEGSIVAARQLTAAHSKVNDELADVFLLLLDIIRRHKTSMRSLVDMAQGKLESNKWRKWPAIDETKFDQPIFHVKESCHSHVFKVETGKCENCGISWEGYNNGKKT